MQQNSRTGRVCGVLALVVGIVGFVVGTGAAPALAVGDLRLQSHTRYVVDSSGVVHVGVDLVVTNTKLNTARFRYFFDRIHIPVAANAAGLQAFNGTRTIGVALETRNDVFGDANLNLSPRLEGGQTQNLRVAYDIPASGARVTGANRINPAYMSFFAFSVGDPGQASVEVQVPDAYDVDVAFEDMDESDANGVTTYTANDIAIPDSWTASITASDESRLDTRHIAVGKQSIDIRSWPDDPEWGKYVASKLRSGLPELEKLVGSRLPNRTTLEITETATPYLYGYAGWYVPVDNTISIGDAFDEVVILHETAHGWFNGDVFADRWVNEGFAQEFSTRAVSALKGADEQPSAPDTNSVDGVALNDWSNPDFRGGSDPARRERFGYNAAFYVMRRIAKEIGPDRTRAVVQAALKKESPFGTATKPDSHSGSYDWQEMLDLFERVGKSRQAAPLFRRYVANDIQQSLFDDHATYVTKYAALERRANDWAPPRFIRSAMADWRYSDLSADLRKADKALDVRDSIVRKLDRLHLTMPKELQTSFEGSLRNEFDEVLDGLERYERAVDQVAAARATADGDRSVWQRVGLIGHDLDKPLATADAALRNNDPAGAIAAANDVHGAVDDAARIGAWRLIKIGSALLLLLFVVWCCHLVLKQREAEAYDPGHV